MWLWTCQESRQAEEEISQEGQEEIEKWDIHMTPATTRYSVCT
jgi:hypothetical protein